MNSGAELPGVPGEAGKRALKANKACVPCRARKTKCDAAEIGLPCSSCTSRQCVKECVLPVRKGRTRKSNHVSPIPGHIRSSQPSTPDPVDVQSPRQTGLDLFYLNILNEAGEKTTESSRHHAIPSTPYHQSPKDSFSPRNCLWAKLPQLDAIDNEFLVKKGVFDLPPSRHLDSLVKLYFDHVYPFAPVISRADFIRNYQSCDCSLFLLHVILTPASVHAPADVLAACGFASRSEAQESFYSKAKLLHDFSTEDNPLLMLQGSIILCMVILDHPTDRDFGYWFHNAIRLATKLDIRNACTREDNPSIVFKLYRRIWWALYSLDIFHVSVNTRRSRLLTNTSTIRLRTEDDWDVEDNSEESSGLLLPVTPQQKALPVVQCELSRIFGQCLSSMTNKPQQDPRQMLHPLDAWRRSLSVKMHVDGNIGADVCYLTMQAVSYRFECVLCRLIRRYWQQTQHADWSEWAKQRLRSAILELDTITKKVLASGTLQDFPVSFITTTIALLALHIESALDTTETDLVRSMAQISISQTMLVLTQGKEIPALKRALPLFEEILAKKNLYLVPPNSVGQSEDNRMVGADAHAQSEQYENNPLLYDDFLGFDLLDEWQIGQMDFIG